MHSPSPLGGQCTGGQGDGLRPQRTAVPIRGMFPWRPADSACTGRPFRAAVPARCAVRGKSAGGSLSVTRRRSGSVGSARGPAGCSSMPVFRTHARARCGLAPGGYLFSSGHVGQGLVSFAQEPLRAGTAEEHGAGQQGSGVPSRRHCGGAAGVPASRPGDVCGLLGQWPAAWLASPACGRGRGDAATRGAGQHLR